MEKLKNHISILKQNSEALVMPLATGCLVLGVLCLLLVFRNSNTKGSHIEIKGQTTMASKTPKPINVDPVHRKAIELVNQNLQTDQKLKELRELGVEIKNEEQLEKIRHQMTELYQHSDVRNLGVDISVNDGSSLVYQDLFENESPIFDGQMTAAEKIEMNIQQQHDMAAYERSQRLQYVNKFLENARKQGYEITLNDKLEVVKVRRVRGDQPYRGNATLSKIFE